MDRLTQIHPCKSEQASVTRDLLSLLLPLIVCAAAITVGWAVVIGTLIYVVADYSKTAVLLTTLGIAFAHAVLAVACWRFAMNAVRRSESTPVYY